MRRIPYGRQFIDKSDIREVVRVLSSDWITQGPKIKEFEEALCKYTRAKYAVAVSSGTAALHIACLAAGIKTGDEVITSPITFVASANCVLYCGGRPVFADIQRDTVNIDPDEVKKKITERTKAIIPVHFAGHPCDLEEIGRLAKERGLAVIEDAAHALGAKYKNSKIGSCKYSDMTILSFHPVKHITTGEGGAVLTNSKDLYEKLLILRNHGITKEAAKLEKNDGSWYYEQHLLGFNYRITDFQCALGASQLKKLERFIERRREIADIYGKKLLSVDEIILPQEKSYVRSAWHLYCIQLKDSKRRRTVFDRLRKEGIGAQVHYIPVHLQPYYARHLNYKKGDYPKAEGYYEKAITLPIFFSLSNPKLFFVIEKLKKALV
ncbi:MAG: UDP-4-amino-4,6-dideoxy-N-acetyl-beta-L-altrosamine transaminase [Candidatus Omnitrophota bacterium]